MTAQRKREISIMGLFKTRHCLVAAVCVVSPLPFAAQEPVLSDEVSYLSFEVPGALGTYPMSVNNSMAVTGYYLESPTSARGFLREGDGTLTTFSAENADRSEPFAGRL
jgi:hypothetical protein